MDEQEVTAFQLVINAWDSARTRLLDGIEMSRWAADGFENLRRAVELLRQRDAEIERQRKAMRQALTLLNTRGVFSVSKVIMVLEDALVDKGKGR